MSQVVAKTCCDPLDPVIPGRAATLAIADPFHFVIILTNYINLD